MRLTIAAIGRARAGPERALFQHYVARLSWPLQLQEVEEKRPLPAAALMRREGELLLAACPPRSLAIALDRRGQALDSVQFADLLRRARDEGVADIAFLIGGTEGHDEKLLQACRQRISFGTMTWPHLLARAMLAEQLYRAQQIIAGHPYHRA